MANDSGAFFSLDGPRRAQFIKPSVTAIDVDTAKKGPFEVPGLLMIISTFPYRRRRRPAAKTAMATVVAVAGREPSTRPQTCPLTVPLRT